MEPEIQPEMSDYEDESSTIKSIPLNIVFAILIVGVLIAITWSRYKCYTPGSSTQTTPNTTQMVQDPFCSMTIDPVPPYMSRESTFVVMDPPLTVPREVVTPGDVMRESSGDLIRVNSRGSYQSSCVSCNSPVDVRPPPYLVRDQQDQITVTSVR